MTTTNIRQFEKLADGLVVRAPAKLNLSLLIAGKRPDGFHEMETVMAKVDWYDEIRIEPAPASRIEFSCQGPCWAPNDATNLAYRAAKQLLRACGKPGGVRLTLTKNIPAGSGLGSGSSDAAATLLGLNTWLNLGCPPSQLVEIAARLGSDVPFFLNGPLALCTGRGEKILALPAPFDFTALVILPNVNSSTKEVYAHYVHDPARYLHLSEQIRACIEEKSLDSVTRLCANMLESSCFHLYEELGDLKEALELLGVGPVCLSGSGSAMFALLNSGDAEYLETMRNKISEATGCRNRIVRNNRW
jgi:4-diphosphocytidyl-2-C-methyl-D-erythritol kinase